MTVFIPGWGFKADIWRYSNAYSTGDLLLNLPCVENIPINKVAEILSEEIPNDSAITGWSLGGLIAIKIATMFPEKVSSITLLSSTPSFCGATGWPGLNIETAASFLNQAKVDFPAYFKRYLAMVNFPDRRVVNKFQLDISQLEIHLTHYLQLLFETDLREDYAELKIPITHVDGDKDAVMTIQNPQLKKLNSNAQFILNEGAGHAFFL